MVLRLRRELPLSSSLEITESMSNRVFSRVTERRIILLGLLLVALELAIQLAPRRRKHEEVFSTSA
jgi:hypothetical protein